MGCLASIMNWLPPLLTGFGSVALVIAVLEMIAFLMAISLCCAKDKSSNDAKVHESKH